MLSKPSRREPLLDLPLFSGCTPVQAERIRSLLTMLTAAPGTVLMSEGTYGVEFLIIADGQARVTTQTPIGELVLATLGAGDFVGEMSLLARDRRSATVMAMTDLTFYVANSAEFAGILDAAPSAAHEIEATAAQRAETNRRLVDAA